MCSIHPISTTREEWAVRGKRLDSIDSANEFFLSSPLQHPSHASDVLTSFYFSLWDLQENSPLAARNPETFNGNLPYRTKPLRNKRTWNEPATPCPGEHAANKKDIFPASPRFSRAMIWIRQQNFASVQIINRVPPSAYMYVWESVGVSSRRLGDVLSQTYGPAQFQ